MATIIWIKGKTGSGKTTVLKKLAGENPIHYLNTLTSGSIALLTGEIFVDNYKKSSDLDKVRLYELKNNPQVTRIYITKE